MIPFVNIKALKRWARENLAQAAILRQVILADEDELSVNDFVSRVSLYLNLADAE